MDPDSYNPDTVDLTRDPDARSYWLQCFEESLRKFAQKAVESQTEHCAGKYPSGNAIKSLFSVILNIVNQPVI